MTPPIGASRAGLLVSTDTGTEIPDAETFGYVGQSVLYDVSGESEIRIELLGAGGSEATDENSEGGLGSRGGLVLATFDVSSFEQLEIWAAGGRPPGHSSSESGETWGRSSGGETLEDWGGYGAGSTEIWGVDENGNNTFLGASDGGGGGGSGWASFNGDSEGGGGGARGGSGGNTQNWGDGEDGEGTGFGGDGGDGASGSGNSGEDGGLGGAEVNSSYASSVTTGTGEGNIGHGQVILYYDEEDQFDIFAGIRDTDPEGAVQKLNPESMQQVRNGYDFGAVVEAMTIDGEYLYTGGRNNQVDKIDPVTMEQVGSSFTEHSNQVWALTTDAEYVYSGGADNAYKINPDDMSVAGTYGGYENFIWSMTTDGDYLYISTGGTDLSPSDGVIYKVDLDTMNEVDTHTGLNGNLRDLLFDGEYLYSSSADGAHKIDPGDMSGVDDYTGINDDGLALGYDGEHLFVSSVDVHKIDPNGMSQVGGVYDGGGENLNSLTFDGENLLGGGSDFIIHRFDPDTMSQIGDLYNSGSNVFSLTSYVWSPVLWPGAYE